MKRRSEPDVGRRFTTESLFTFSSEFSDRRRRKATNEREKTYLDVSNDVESLKYLTFFFNFRPINGKHIPKIDHFDCRHEKNVEVEKTICKREIEQICFKRKISIFMIFSVI